MQAQVLLGAQLLHSVIRKFLRCFLPLAGHIAGGSAQAFQLFAVRFNLGFRLFAGVFCLGGGRSVLPQLLFQRGDLLPAVGGSILTLFQRGVQLIQLHLGFQAGRSGGHALALGTGQLGGQVIHLRFAGGGFLFGCCAALVQFQHLGTQFVQFLLAAEHTHAARGGTAGKGTACVDDLAVHCDNAVAVAKIFGHHRRFAQILHHNNAAQQVINNMLVLGAVSTRSAATSAVPVRRPLNRLPCTVSSGRKVARPARSSFKKVMAARAQPWSCTTMFCSAKPSAVSIAISYPLRTLRIPATGPMMPAAAHRPRRA